MLTFLTILLTFSQLCLGTPTPVDKEDATKIAISEPMNQNRFATLPNEIQKQILSELPLNDRAKVGMTSTELKEKIDPKEFKKRLALNNEIKATVKNTHFYRQPQMFPFQQHGKASDYSWYHTKKVIDQMRKNNGVFLGIGNIETNLDLYKKYKEFLDKHNGNKILAHKDLVEYMENETKDVYYSVYASKDPNAVGGNEMDALRKQFKDNEKIYSGWVNKYSVVKSKQQ